MRIFEHPKVELGALYAAVCNAASQEWEHCPAGTYPLFPTPRDMERIIPAAEASSRAPDDPNQRNREYRVQPGELLFGQRQGCYSCGSLDHFERECPNQ